MKAAVLHNLGESPRFEDFPDPVAHSGELIVRVRAASLKNIDKALASGTHYDRHAHLPVVCGVDGVGVLDVWRAQLKPGETVLILGATGVAGKLAIQIARHLGAGRVVAVGRNSRVLETLPGLGADAIISLDQSDRDLAAAFVREAGHGPFDIVLDYLWGHPTTVLLDALTGHDIQAESSRIRLIEIGEMAGPTISLPAAALRSSGIEIYGSGGGGSIPRTARLIWAQDSYRFVVD